MLLITFTVEAVHRADSLKCDKEKALQACSEKSISDTKAGDGHSLGNNIAGEPTCTREQTVARALIVNRRI